VVAATRNPEVSSLRVFDDIAAVTLDASDPVSAQPAFASCEDAAGPVRRDFITWCTPSANVTSETPTRPRRPTWQTAARDAGVKRIVYLGGFVPADEGLSEHLASRAEVADALTVEDGPELVWLGAAMIIGAGSTSFEMMRYVGDRFPVMPIPDWMTNPIDPISVRDVLHYLVAAADAAQVPAGAYDICGPPPRPIGSCCKRMRAFPAGGMPLCRSVESSTPAGVTDHCALRSRCPPGLPETWSSRWITRWWHPSAACAIECPTHPAACSPSTMPSALALADRTDRRPLPVNGLADPHHLADTDPSWAGGDALAYPSARASGNAAAARPTLGLLNIIPGPLAGALRTGLDILVTLTPKVRPA